MDKYFANDYFEARTTFLKNAQALKLEISSHLMEHAKGPENKDIYMDCAFAKGKNPKNLLILISGTHGPEGYCGSAFQSYFMESGLFNKVIEKTSILLIHAHNPFGFAWDSRFNEDNIDLNRNYISDFSNPPANPEYEELAQWSLPIEFDDNSINQATARLMQYAQENGFAALQNALTAGQYKHQKGVYFGGFAPSWSNKTLNSVIDSHIDEVEKLYVIDFHTGLGPFGHGEILSDFSPDSPEFARVSTVFGIDTTSTKAMGSVSAAVHGSLDSGICEKYKNLNPISIALEFGTLDPLTVFKATQATSWAQSYDRLDSPTGQKMRRLSRDAFYPQSSEWNHKIIKRGEEIILKVLEKL